MIILFDLGTAVGYLMLDTSGFNSGFEKAQAGMKSFMDNTSSAKDRLFGLGTAMTSVGGTLTKSITLPLVGAGTAIMKVGNDFEAQMSRVQAIAGATGEELGQLNDLALKLGADTSFSAAQAAEGMENLASAGFSVNEIIDAMPGLLDLAASSGAELGTATEIAASALRGFGLDASEAGHVADVFAEASARTNAQVEDMGEAMKYIAPVAKAMGQSLEETAAAVGILSDAGIKGSQAGTSLRGMLSQLAKPSEAAATAMELIGLNVYDLNGDMLSLSEIIRKTQEATADLTQEERNFRLVQIFGQEALSGVLALMERGPDTIEELTESFEKADGAAKQMADVMLDNTAGSIEAMFGSIETLSIKIQQVMAPIVQSIVEKITEFVNMLSSADESTLRLVTTIGAIAAATGPLLIVFGSFAKSISNIISLLSGAGGLSGVLGALTGPIGIVIAAVAALAAAWATDFGGIRDKTKEIFDSISSIISSVMNIIKTIWETNFLGIREIATQAWEMIEQTFSDALDIIVDLFNVFESLFSGDWEQLWEDVKKMFSDIWNAIIDLLGNFLNLIVDTIIRLGVRLGSAASEAFEHIGQSFEDVWNDIVSWFEGAINDPVGTVLSIGSSLYDAGRDIFDSLWDGLESVWNSISDWVSDCVDWIVDKVKFWENESAKVNRDGEFGSKSSGSFASGLDYVPRTMNVTVHEGERILTKEENKAYGSGSYARLQMNVTFTHPVDSNTAKKVSRELARETEKELRGKGVVLV